MIPPFVVGLLLLLQGQGGHFSTGAHLCPSGRFSWEASGSSDFVYSWCSPWLAVSGLRRLRSSIF